MTRATLPLFMIRQRAFTPLFLSVVEGPTVPVASILRPSTSLRMSGNGVSKIFEKQNWTTHRKLMTFVMLTTGFVVGSQRPALTSQSVNQLPRKDLPSRAVVENAKFDFTFRICRAFDVDFIFSAPRNKIGI